MRLVHFADVHLGYRNYHRLTSKGINQREQDVQDSFDDLLRQVVELQPDLVLMAGDLFHSVRPSNLVLQRTFRRLLWFTQRVSAPVVMIAGNHESPRSAESGCILKLFENIPGITVKDGRYEAVKLSNLNASVFCLPHRGLEELSQLHITPDPDSATNLLMLHGTLEGVQPSHYEGRTLSRSQILGDGWDYIACGHYHIHTRLAENAYYSGSVEYTSLNPWEETGKGIPRKGFIEFDTETREMKFHPIKTRVIRDLPEIHGKGLSAQEITEKILDTAGKAKGDLSEEIVRLVVWDVPRKVQSDLDWGKLREVRSLAFHFDLSIRTPRAVGFSSLSSGTGVRRTLEQEWKEYSNELILPGGVERERLCSLGEEYLTKVAAEAVPADGTSVLKS